jgi:GXWXG protein/Domain of unknown function (DUF4334)
MTMLTSTTAGSRPDWPAGWPDDPANYHVALAWFDTLPGVEPEAIIGHWNGRGLPTGHPLDGVLESLGWYGKVFESAERVHPLLFRTNAGTLIPLDPRFMPVRVALRWPAFAKSGPVRMIFGAVRRFVRTDRSAARLEVMTFRGKRSTAMIYTRKPITDHFRRIDDDRLLGLMQMFAMEKPYFFLLTRDQDCRT